MSATQARSRTWPPPSQAAVQGHAGAFRMAAWISSVIKPKSSDDAGGRQRVQQAEYIRYIMTFDINFYLI